MKWYIKDADGNILNTYVGAGDLYPVGSLWMGTEIALVEEVVPLVEDIVDNRDVRRLRRAEEFSSTLDVLNPFWYASLSTDQQTLIGNWRQAWLDYPNDENATEPQRPDGIF
jgi:hypothetical protein